MASGFIDIHCHILPGLDDGPPDINHTLKMLEAARADGVKAIVASPHIIDGIYNNTKQGILRAAAELRKHAGDIKLFIGADIHICRDLVKRVSNGELPMINDKNYLLLELPHYVMPPLREVERLLGTLAVMRIVPVITHPERNLPMLEDISIMKRLMTTGAIFQVTASSITNRFGSRIQKAAFRMIKKGYVHAVASDAHDAEKRPPVLSEAYEQVMKNFGPDEAGRLFLQNPMNIINGEPVFQNG